MEVTSINEGIIIDHVPAGRSFTVLNYLHIDPKTTRLALIMNAASRSYGTKDIIKIEGRTQVDLHVLALVAPDARSPRSSSPPFPRGYATCSPVITLGASPPASEGSTSFSTW